MEPRKITIVETKNQRKSVIMSAATTLEELKTDLRANNINYTDMTFYEGTSKVELTTNNSVLPHDVPYKGTITNELVFMLTNTNKKICSGSMSRNDAYAIIKKMNLSAKCKEKYGKNFTMCKTNDLISLIEENKPKTEVNTPKVVDNKSEKTESTDNIVEIEHVDPKAREAIKKILNYLYDESIIDDNDIKDISNMFNSSSTEASDNTPKKVESSYSNDEIDDMFSDMEL